MRYFEIVEISEAKSKAKLVLDQSARNAEALRRLRSRQAEVTDKVAAANALPPGPEKARRLSAAERRQRDAKRIFSNTQNKCHDRMADILSNLT